LNLLYLNQWALIDHASSVAFLA